MPRAQTVTSACLLLLLVGTACTDGGDRPSEATGVTDATDEADVTDEADEAVTIAADGLELAGTLRLPAGPGPHVGVVIAHGSGPQSRQGLSPGQLGLTLPRQVPVYAELAEGLRDAGYGVLTFDKRSCGPFNGCAENGYPPPSPELTFDTFVADVEAVLDHLAAREDIAELALIGHSKGGTIAAQLADERDDLATVVLLATPAVPIDEVLATQADTLGQLVEAVGQAGTAADQAVLELRTLADDVAAIAAGDLDGGPVAGVHRGFWDSWIAASRTAPEQVRDAQPPVLALGGSRDWNVLPAQVEAWERHLGPDDRLVILPEVTHALTRLGGDDPATLTAADLGTSVDARVIDAVVDWLATAIDR